jgi:hypothetical protein
VPNWASCERRLFRERWIALDAPRHLYHFTPRTLGAMLARCGFVPGRVTVAAPPLSLSSNVLRWLGSTFLRRGQAKVLHTPLAARPATNSISPLRRFLIALVSQTMRLPNAALNRLNRGAAISVVARKV